MFFNKNNGNIVHVNDIKDLKLHKIKPADLQKIYIDKNGQEHKLKYDPLRKKVIIVRIIKGVLNGKYVKNKYDDIATDDRIKSEFKHKIGEMGKEYLKNKYNITGQEPEKLQEQPLSFESKGKKEKEIEEQKKTEDQVKSSDGIVIEKISDVSSVIEKVIERLEISLKNIIESNVFNERFGFDDKMVLDDIRRIVKTDIIGEFQNLKEIHEDTLKGYNDTKLKNKAYGEKIKALLAVTPRTDHINILRELESIEIFQKGLKSILKSFDDIEYKLSIISGDKINARNFHERQKFSDGQISLQTCKSDTIKIIKHFEGHYNQKFK